MKSKRHWGGLHLRSYGWRLVILLGMIPCGATVVEAQTCPTPVGRIVAVSNPGTMSIGAFNFPLPGGVAVTIDGGLVDPFAMSQELTIPPGGFNLPGFCIPALQYTAGVVPTGCESGTALGQGTGWAASAPCPDPEVQKVGDTSAPPCATIGSGCNSSAMSAGKDDLGDIDTTRGGTFPGDAGPCTVNAPGVHVQFDIPVHARVWQDAAGCPGNGVYNPAEGDTLISEFPFILSPTTDQARAAFADKNGDGCAGFGAGPLGPVTVVGSPAAGPGCIVGQNITLVAAGLAFSGDYPMYDTLYKMTIPNTIASCGPTAGFDSCVLTTNPCDD